MSTPQRPPQQQHRQPGLESDMTPRPKTEDQKHHGRGKLAGKAALISGIGRAAAVAFAREGADVAVLYLDEHKDAEETKQLVEQEGRRCLALSGDIGDAAWCGQAVEQTVREFGRLDILVNNAAEQHPQDGIEKITPSQLERTFRTNIFSYFYLTQAALRHLGEGSTIINTTYQYDVGDRLQGQRAPSGLFGYQRRHCLIDSLPLAVVGRAQNSRQCRGPWSGLDAADSLDVPSG